MLADSFKLLYIAMENRFLVQTDVAFSYRDRLISFFWQHLLLLLSLFIMTFGVALTIRSSLGSSVISSVPMAMSLAGGVGNAPKLTVGEYTNIMNIILVGIQILILRRRFEKIQLFQLVIGTVFGLMLDISMALTSAVVTDSLPGQILAQSAGCVILGVGIAFEMKCGSVTMPGEGVPAAISKSLGTPFPKAKIATDIILVAAAVIVGYIFFGRWLVDVIGPGTVFAMVFVGIVVKWITPRISWFDQILAYRPGFRRYIYGLARFVKSGSNKR